MLIPCHTTMYVWHSTVLVVNIKKIDTLRRQWQVKYSREESSQQSTTFLLKILS